MRKQIPLSLKLTRLGFRTLGRLAPGLAGLWAYRLWFSTRRFPEPRRERRWIETAEQGTMPVDNVPVTTYTWNASASGTAILVHGWNGRGPQLGGLVAPLTASGYRVVAFDAPGHGRTPGTQTNIYEFSAALQHIAKAYAPVHAIIAHSFGVPVSVLAISQGLDTRCAVGICSPASAEELLERFSGFLHLPKAVDRKMRRRIERRFGVDTWSRLSAEALASKLNVPALIIHDRNDEQVPLSDGERVARAWPGAKFVVTEGLGHRRILANEDVHETVIDFVNRYRQDTG